MKKRILMLLAVTAMMSTMMFVGVASADAPPGAVGGYGPPAEGQHDLGFGPVGERLSPGGSCTRYLAQTDAAYLAQETGAGNVSVVSFAACY